MKKNILLIKDLSEHEELSPVAFQRNEIAEEPGVFKNSALAPEIAANDATAPRFYNNERTRSLSDAVLTLASGECDFSEITQNRCTTDVRVPVTFGEFVEFAKQLGQYWLRINEPWRCLL